MVRNIILKFMAIFIIIFLAVPSFAQDGASLKTQRDKVSYAVGVDLGRNIKRQGIDTQTEELVRGIRDALLGEKLLLSEEELSAALNEFQIEMKLKRAKTARIVGEENKRNGEAFLTGNKKKEGVISLPSGLQYKILKEGNGNKPIDTDTVEVTYRGTLLDGTEFDNSYRYGRPVTFKVKGVIPGWTEALKLMPVGSRWQLFIPPTLAYGEKGSLPLIGPNATLVFEVELLSIK